jgi:hypothetical protein
MEWVLRREALTVTHEEAKPCATPTGSDVTGVVIETKHIAREGSDIMRDTWTR